MLVKSSLISASLVLSVFAKYSSEILIPIPVTGGIITSGYGDRIDPITKDHRIHSGVDIVGQNSPEVIAVGSGVIIFSGEYGDYGNLLSIQHGNQITSHYAHLRETYYQVGENVERGAIIGIIGSTGKSTAEHLHFEIRKDGIPIDPIEAIPDLKTLAKL